MSTLASSFSVCTRQTSTRSISPSAPFTSFRSRCLRSSRLIRTETKQLRLACRAEGNSSEGKEDGEKTPVWAEPGSSVPPPWAREGDKTQTQTDENRPFELPFALYLLFSVFTCIAAVGSIFEYTARNPLFGVVPPENPVWAPILLTFAITGFPTAGFLLSKAIAGFNKFAEEDDRKAGL